MIKIGVLRGGPSGEHDVSLKTGESVISALRSGSKNKYDVCDILLGKNNDWHFDGKISSPDRVLRSIDVVFNALHGSFGEDGKIQHILETFGAPYTGSGVFASAVGMNKALSREIFRNSGLKIPRAAILEKDKMANETSYEIFRTIGLPVVVKPASSGSSLGISIAEKFGDLDKALRAAFALSDKVLAEEYIKGREATCGVVESFRGKDIYALPVIEIIPPAESQFFTYSAKYSGETREICPANFSPEIKKEIERMARLAHQSLGCRHYSRADFIVSNRGIYILEINTLPGLTSESLLPKAISAVGSSYNEFLDHLISLALKK